MGSERWKILKPLLKPWSRTTWVICNSLLLMRPGTTVKALGNSRFIIQIYRVPSLADILASP